MHTLQAQLRGFCHPACEAMPDAVRLTHLVRLGTEVADRVDALETDSAGLRCELERTRQEARECFDAMSEIDEAWDAIGTRGNRGTLTLAEQLASLFREDEERLEKAEAEAAELRDSLVRHAARIAEQANEIDRLRILSPAAPQAKRYVAAPEVRRSHSG